MVEAKVGVELGIEAEEGLIALDILDGEDLSCFFFSVINFGTGMFCKACTYDGRDEILD